MRKILIMILIVILLVALGIMSIQGLNIGKFRINSVQDIIADNKNLDEEIATLSYSIDNDYETAKNNLQSSFQALLKSKQDYQDTITFSSEDEIKAANQVEEYKLDYLWTKIGLYATKNNLEMHATVSYGSNGITGQYNLNFTVVGEYISISEFIYAIENDSNLGFKIEDFSLVPYSSVTTDEDGNTITRELLQANFAIKNIEIDQKSITTVQPSTTSSSNVNQNEEDTNQVQSTTEVQ